MQGNEHIGWTEVAEAPVGEIKRRRVSRLGTVTVGRRFKGKSVWVIENADGSLTIREAK